ncbi:PEP-CTERM sorting domain-containing protein [Nostoc sp.]|uniref:PEP-CTERM sorting domain-containing protein n=1 Tax=Nostoc sp. TaxID=1180 RepID=UPI002FFC769D
MAITAAVVGFGLGTLNAAQAATFTVNASDEGWWAAEGGLNVSNSNDNTNYVTGNIRGTDLRDFFTFNLGNTAKVSSATLQIQRFDGSENGTKTLGFFDVSTPANVLSKKVNSPNNTIYSDLGSGKNYGTFKVSSSGDSDQILSFVLNSKAIADINTRKGQFFSIGGALQGDLEEDYLFSGSGNGSLAKLVIDNTHLATDPEQHVIDNTHLATVVPEPHTLGGIVVAGVAGLWLKRKRKASITG